MTQITWHGRKMKTGSPTVEQLAIFQRTAKRFSRFANTPEDHMLSKEESGEFAKLVDRFVVIVESLLTDQDDKDWLEDQLFDGTIKIAEMPDLLGKIAEVNKGKTVKVPVKKNA